MIVTPVDKVCRTLHRSHSNTPETQAQRDDSRFIAPDAICQYRLNEMILG